MKKDSKTWIMVAVGLALLLLVIGPSLGLFSTMNYDSCISVPLTADQVNLLPKDGNFESGAWEAAGDSNCGQCSCINNVVAGWDVPIFLTTSATGNSGTCRKTDGSESRSWEVIARSVADNNAPLGSNVLELVGTTANAANAVGGFPFTIGETYTLSFWFKHVQGSGTPAYCMWREGTGSGISGCAPSNDFPVTDNEWHYYQESFTVPEGTNTLNLFLYASGAVGETTINRYDDVRIVQGASQCLTQLPTEDNTCVTDADCTEPQKCTAGVCSLPIKTGFDFNQTMFGIEWLKMWMLIAAGGLVIVLVLFKK
jgi:hypothetical protein